MINVCDREGAFWSLLTAATLSGAALLARASRSARRQAVLEGGGKADLWNPVAAQPRLAKQALELPARGD